MQIYEAPFYKTEYEITELLKADKLTFPYSDTKMKYDGLRHKYKPTAELFTSRGIDLQQELDDKSANAVENFLKYISRQIYDYTFRHSKTGERELLYYIAKAEMYNKEPFNFRDDFMEAMYLQGIYYLTNSNIRDYSGVDFSTQQALGKNVMFEQDRHMHKDAIGILTNLGLVYSGRMNIRISDTRW